MDKLFVTKTFLPPLEEYLELLKEIWETGYITNDGPMFQRLEQDISCYTGIEHLVCMGNGTWALQLAIRALNLTGEVITTPFTHVASSGTLVWEGCTPVYCDIDPQTLNIDPTQIEQHITEKTSAILAVHVYSNPCDMEAIGSIAKKYKLKVIYDGAHAFGAEYRGQSVFAHGDISMASFNATKGFHTVEGGALFVKSQEMEDAVRRLAYFGMDKNKVIKQQYGTNAKLIEFCAAMGIVNLRYLPEALRKREERYMQYLSLLQGNPNISFQKLTDKINYSYMPVVLSSKEFKIEILDALHKKEVFPREYFHPSLEIVFKQEISCPVAYDIADRVICLPMSDYLSAEQVEMVCNAVNAVK